MSLRPVEPGQRPRMRAGEQRAVIEAANAAQMSRNQDTPTRPAERQPCIISALMWGDGGSDAAADRERGDVMELGLPSVLPSDNPEEGYRDRPVFQCHTPRSVPIISAAKAIGRQSRRFCVMLADVPAYQIGPAMLAGECMAKVYIHDPGHAYATVAAGQHVLVSAETGPVTVLWAPGVTVWGDSALTGQQLCLVRLGPWIPRVGFQAEATGETGVSSGVSRRIDFGYYWTIDNTNPNRVIVPAYGAFPRMSGWTWQSSDQTFRCQQPGCYAIRGHFSCIGGGYSPSPLRFTSFAVTLSTSTAGAIGGDATTIVPGPGSNYQGSVHFEQWHFFAYNDAFYVDALYTNPDAGYGDAAEVHGNLAVELMELEGRPSP